jgi:hypothetical protein
MIRMFVRHEVADFDSWKKAYDDFGKERQGMGVVGDAVYRSIDNDNAVTVTHDFQGLEQARAFIESPRLKEVMTAAGVTSAPVVWFTNPA